MFWLIDWLIFSSVDAVFLVLCRYRSVTRCSHSMVSQEWFWTGRTESSSGWLWWQWRRFVVVIVVCKQQFCLCFAWKAKDSDVSHYFLCPPFYYVLSDNRFYLVDSFSWFLVSKQLQHLPDHSSLFRVLCTAAWCWTYASSSLYVRFLLWLLQMISKKPLAFHELLKHYRAIRGQIW